MATVHTEYGPGKIIASETVRGRTRFKVAGEGFEVWLDETKLGAYERPEVVDYNAPHWEGYGPDDDTVYPEPYTPVSPYDDVDDIVGPERDRLRQHPDYLFDDDPDAKHARLRRRAMTPDEWAERETNAILDDDPYAEYGYDHDAETRGYGEHADRYTPGAPGSYDDDPDAKFARRRTALTPDEWAEREMGQVLNDDPYAEYGYDHDAEARGYDGEHPDRFSPGSRGSYDDDPDARHARRQVVRGKAGSSRTAWAPLDRENSTELPYNPDPQHEAVAGPGDDDSSTIQPIHHIDADERTRSADSLSFEGEGDGDEPGPNPDLFAKQAFTPPWSAVPHEVRHRVKQVVKDKLRDRLPEGADPYIDDGVDAVIDRGTAGMTGHGIGTAMGYGLNMAKGQIDNVLDAASPGPGWGPLLHNSARHQAGPEMLLPLVGPALRAVAPTLVGQGLGAAEHALSGAGSSLEDVGTDLDGWGPLAHEGSARPAGLSDKYIDLTASVDYWNDPVAQFRHDPDAYINRIGHLLDEGLNPRFAEYMDLVEGDSSVRTAAWKDVRAKAMRLKTSGAVHVKDLAPGRIMASVDGDHGTYDVTILKGATFGGLNGNAISNWHCACEWGKWAFRRKFTFVGRLCSHAYASYLTMQSAALKNEPRRPKRGPADTVIVNRPARDRALPTFQFAAGRRTADALQNGPERLVPELAVNDTDDAHMFVDVEKDERTDTGPDDVVSEKDIVHFARLMRHCEVTQRPYPRQLVAFLARYANEADDTQADYRASDADDADSALNALRADADRDQEADFGSMAERVRRIQDTVEEARDNGADASQFVASVRKMADPNKVEDNSDQRGYGLIDYFRDNAKATNEKEQARQKGQAPSSSVPRDNSKDPRGESALQTLLPDNSAAGMALDGLSGKSKGSGVSADTDYQAPGNKGGGNGPHGGYGDKGRQYKKQQEFWDNRAEQGNQYKKQQEFWDNRAEQGRATGQPSQAPQDSQGSQGSQGPGASTPAATGAGADAPAGGKGGEGGAAGGAAGTGKYTAPGGGQTSGTVSDGGVAGAENGNNSAITKTSPNVDANGMYTVQKGDTWTDLAQRATGDMNNYQKLYDVNKSVAGPNIDDLAEGTQVNLKDFLNDTGNNNIKGDATNPKGGGSDSDPATVDAGPAMKAPAVDTNVAAGKPADPAPAAGNSGTGAANGVASSESLNSNSQLTSPGLTPPNQGKPESALRRRVAAPSDGSDSSSTDSGGQPSADAQTPGGGTRQPAGTNPASPSSSGTRSTVPGGAKPASPSSFGPSIEDTYDPTDPTQMRQQQNSLANPSAQAGSSAPAGRSDSVNQFTNPTGMSGADIGSMVGQGVSGAADLASSAMSALPGLSGIASGIGNAVSGIASGLGSIFSSRQDFDDWVRYAYPTGDGEGKLEPHTHPFAGSGYPGPLEVGTSEDYADKARKKHDDVTDLGSHDVHTPMGDWQKQSSRRMAGDGLKCRHQNWEEYEPGTAECYDCGEIIPRPYNPDETVEGLADRGSIHLNSVGYSTDDDSDIVRTFQAHLGETALGAGAGGGGGRFDDFASAAQGFLRTAGRNYSLAEQSELIREGDKGGARNLDSLDLKGTHYEDMHTLGW